MPYKQVQWQSMEVIKSAKLNDMVANDKFLNDRKLSGAIRNISRDGEYRSSPNYIKEQLGICAGYKEFRPGTSFPQDQVDKNISPVFTKEITFPNGFFDPEFKPVVVCNIGVIKGIRRITWSVQKVTARAFTVAIRELEPDANFERDMEYSINWIAFGVMLP